MTLSEKLAGVLCDDRRDNPKPWDEKLNEFMDAIVLLVKAHEMFDPHVRTKVAKKLMQKESSR